MQLCVCVCTVYNTPAIADMRVHVYVVYVSLISPSYGTGKTSMRENILSEQNYFFKFLTSFSNSSSCTCRACIVRYTDDSGFEVFVPVYVSQTEPWEHFTYLVGREPLNVVLDGFKIDTI